MARMMRRPGESVPHFESVLCLTYRCEPFEKEKAVATDVPNVDFKIETKYITGGTRYEAGWKWALKWPDEASGGTLSHFEHGYGYQTRAAAKLAAETEAKAIVLSAIPVETYDFTVTL